MIVERVEPRWTSSTCAVLATGPSLTAEVAETCRAVRAIAVNDAYRLAPWAEVLFACDGDWWDHHKGCSGFAGEKWSSHGTPCNDKRRHAERYGLRLVAGVDGPGFSRDPTRIHYGANSGFQALNLALLFGARRIALVGFDMRSVEGRQHFFGAHGGGLRAPDFALFLKRFELAARTVPRGVEVVNCTPGSALKCFPTADLRAFL